MRRYHTREVVVKVTQKALPLLPPHLAPLPLHLHGHLILAPLTNWMTFARILPSYGKGSTSSVSPLWKAVKLMSNVGFASQTATGILVDVNLVGCLSNDIMVELLGMQKPNARKKNINLNTKLIIRR